MFSSQNTAASSGETVWVLGYGQFGQRAVKLLRKTAPTSKIVVVDSQPISEFQGDVEVVCADGVEWFAENFTSEADVTKIIPALPVHLAAQWIKKKLTNEQRIIHSEKIPDSHLHQFPHPIRLTPHSIVMSYADFICPANCSEPEDLCTYTQLARPLSLYLLLETTVLGNFKPLIVRSRQFALGVGGFLPTDLWHLLERVRALPETPLLIGTACKCHGIVDGFRHTMVQL